MRNFLKKYHEYVLGRKEYTLTPLMYAARLNKPEIIPALLNLGYHLETQDMRGYSAVHHAGQHGSLKFLKALEKYGAHLAALTPSGLTSLHLAAQYNRVPAAAYLVQKIPVDVPTVNGTTPLMYAAFYGHLAMFEVLRGHHANIKATTLSGADPMMFVISENDGRSQSIPRTGQHLEIAKQLLSSGYDVNHMMMVGQTQIPLLSLAVVHKRHELVKLLLARDADMTKVPLHSRLTAFDYAKQSDDFQIIDTLTEAFQKRLRQACFELKKRYADFNHIPLVERERLERLSQSFSSRHQNFLAQLLKEELEQVFGKLIPIPPQAMKIPVPSL